MKKSYNQISQNITVLTIWRLLVVISFFSVERILFFLFNKSYFPGISFSHLIELMISGLKFDLSAVLYTNVIFILMMILPFRFRLNDLYQRVAKWIFLITNSIALAANTIDIVYFRYTMRRTDFGVFKEFGETENISKILLTAFAQNFYLVFLFALLVFLLWRSYGKSRITDFSFRPVPYYLTSLGIMLLSFWLFVAGVRGGFDRTIRPITLSSAGEKVIQPIETAIVLNTPFSIYRTISKSTFQRQNFYTEAQLVKIYTPVHQPVATAGFQKLNVVVLIMESFTKENSGLFNPAFNGKKYSGYTPFLDSLSLKSKTWLYSYANGTKSIDAIPSVLGGIPSLVQPFVLSRYALNKMDGLASVLGREGYYTAFFHGAPNGSMGFDAISNMLGFQHYFGQTEYGNNKDADGYWGVRDEEFLQFYAHKMSSFKEPFLTSVFTLSSHHPYKLPPRYEKVFTRGTLPLHPVVEYADYSLKRFFETASKQKWYKNTLFVITADHSLPSPEHAEYQSSTGVFSIPVLFFRPGTEAAGIDSVSLMQQIDILPSVLGYLNYPKPFFAFGRNQFDTTKKRFVANYINGVYQFMQDDYVIHSDGKRLLAVFQFKKDPLLKNNLVSQNLPEANEVFQNFKAYLQQYNNRMIDNKLQVNR